MASEHLLRGNVVESNLPQGKVVFWGGSSLFSDEIFGKYDRQSWAFGNLREDNDFADVTLACEDDQQVEAHKVILAGQVLVVWLFHSHHHIKVIVEKLGVDGQASRAKDKSYSNQVAELLELNYQVTEQLQLNYQVFFSLGCWTSIT